MRYDIGVDRIMWGNDFSHREGTFPYTIEALRYVFAGVPEAEVRAMLAGNVAKVYGFDLDGLQPVVDRVGPLFDDIATPIPDIPEAARTTVFLPALAERKRLARLAASR